MAKERQVNSIAECLHPILYEVNARVLVNELSRREGKRVTLGEIPDSMLDTWEGFGFTAIWLMGVWTTGTLGQEIARAHEGLQGEYRRALPDFVKEDVLCSPYAVTAYAVSPALGGNKGLKILRERLAARGISLVLDFIANHTAQDHEWVASHPDYYVCGEAGDESKHPDIYFSTSSLLGQKTLAFGRDPTYPGWTDTAQLNHADPGMRRALIEELTRIAGMCDGVRCDMAMLVLKSVFVRTWGDRSTAASGGPPVDEFWKDAIAAVRKESPGFVFIAEAYWDLEWELQHLGFDYTYDKRLYDRLLREGASAVRDHLKAEMEYQLRSVRFIENHDEDRAAHALPSESWQYAAAVVAATVPGMFLIHEGQMEGSTVRLPVQLGRRSEEVRSERTRTFYQSLLSVLRHEVFREGSWRLLSSRPGWQENLTWQNFLLFWWQTEGGAARMVVVNYAPHSGQCYVEIPAESISGHSIEFRDLMGTASFVRERAGIMHKGMYFDLPGYGMHIFEVKAGRN